MGESELSVGSHEVMVCLLYGGCREAHLKLLLEEQIF